MPSSFISLFAFCSMGASRSQLLCKTSSIEGRLSGSTMSIWLISSLARCETLFQEGCPYANLPFFICWAAGVPYSSEKGRVPLRLQDMSILLSYLRRRIT